MSQKKNKVMREHFEERLSGGADAFAMVPPLPRNLNIEVNNTCNQHCVFCPYHGLYTPRPIKPAVLNIDFVKRLLEQAKGLGIGENELGFYLAGEALLYKGLEEITSFAKKLGFKYIFLTTNGALADENRLKRLIDAGIDSIRFSVNAPDRERYAEIHGSDDFLNVVRNIKYTHNYIIANHLDVATSLSCVMTKRTSEIETDMRKLFEEYVDDIMFIPVTLNRLTNLEEVKEIYEIINDDDRVVDPDFICPLLFNTMYINASGKVVPCCNAYDDGTYFADLNDNDDLKAVWYNEEYGRYRRIFIEKESDEGTICETCLLRCKTVKRLSYEG